MPPDATDTEKLYRISEHAQLWGLGRECFERKGWIPGGLRL
jgi:hypothetical protein